MPIQKTFKGRVRARMAKSGEAYTAARAQLLKKADARALATAQRTSAIDVELPASDEAIQRGTGRNWREWFDLLDAWRAESKRHSEIARWLREEHEIDGWYAQSVTVGYERARGMRAKHELSGGFSVSATKTVRVPPDQAFAAFTDARLRRKWLPEAPMRRRPTRAAASARFDWPEPSSIVVVTVAAKGIDRTIVAITHERLPDSRSADALKGYWRSRLADLKVLLEQQ